MTKAVFQTTDLHRWLSFLRFCRRARSDSHRGIINGLALVYAHAAADQTTCIEFRVTTSRRHGLTQQGRPAGACEDWQLSVFRRHRYRITIARPCLLH
jgi:hypothetical protein